MNVITCVNFPPSKGNFDHLFLVNVEWIINKMDAWYFVTNRYHQTVLSDSEKTLKLFDLCATGVDGSEE